MLLVWFDKNSNGVSEQGEVGTVSSHGVTTIRLNDQSVVPHSPASGGYVGLDAVFDYASPGWRRARRQQRSRTYGFR